MVEMTRRTALTTLGAVGTVGVLGLGIGGAQQADSAQLRFLHAVPDGPSVDVLVDGSTALSGAVFGDVGAYSGFAPGEHTVQVVVAEDEMAPPGNETETPPGNETETPPGNETETPPGTETETPQGTETETPQGTETETPPGTETETPPGTETETETETETPQGTETETETETPQGTETETPQGTETETPPGNETGTPTVTQTPDGTTEALLETTVSLESDTDYTLAIAGEAGGLQPLLLTDDADPEGVPSTASAVRAVHLSPDAPSVDVGVQTGAVLAQQLSYLSSSEYVEGPVGETVLNVREVGDSASLVTTDVDLTADESYSVYVVGLLGDEGTPSLRLLTVEDGVVSEGDTPTETPPGNETETPPGNETETPQGTETETPQGTETETPQGTETETPQGTETETPQGTETETSTETATSTN